MTTMIKVDNVSKQYKLGQIGGTTLRDELQRKRAKLRGEEDPTKRIGAKEYAKDETFMALDGISFEVRKGERVGIIGRNGAGKSTLLKLLSRITAPTGGEIGLNGRVASMLEVGTGFHGELTGRENIYMNGAILGMTKKEIDAKIEDIIEFSECRQFIDTPVKRYSSGMYVKLAFSVAAHLDSEILIMDEVLAVGDMAFQKKCLDKMNDVSRQEGRTILYVSHNMNTIRQLCDRVIVLDHGKIAFDGEVEEGIDIYMGKAAALNTHYEYDDSFRKWRTSEDVRMTGLDILNSDGGIIPYGKPIEFVLHCAAGKDYKNVELRFVISSGGTISGTTFLNKMISGNKGDLLDLHISLPSHNFVPTRYSVAAILYEKDDFGNEVILDRIEPAMIFEITMNGGNAFPWRNRWWGYTHYDAMILHTESDS